MQVEKKLLIISTKYLCGNAIASVRPRKIAKYLHATGRYKINVLTIVGNSAAGNELFRQSVDLSIMERESYINNYINVPQINSRALLKKIKKLFISRKKNYNNETALTDTKSQNIITARNKAVQFFVYVSDMFDDISFYRRAKKEIRKGRLWETDIIFSTYGPPSCHYIARYIKKKNPNVFWVADFRDTVYNEATPALFAAYAKRFAKEKCKTADVITAVSQGIYDCTQLPNVPAHIIPLGFDCDDVPAASNESSKKDKLVFAYTGSLYDNKRDMTALFRILRELIDDNGIDKNKIRIEYAGADENDFIKQIEFFNLRDISHSYGFVSREQALEIQKNCDILLLSEWNDETNKDSLTGKLPEYMAMKKPVLAVITGNIPDSLIYNVINTCSLGFCYEEARGESGRISLKEYILMQYNRFAKYGSVLFDPNNEEVNRYNYANITGDLEKLWRNI